MPQASTPISSKPTGSLIKLHTTEDMVYYAGCAVGVGKRDPRAVVLTNYNMGHICFVGWCVEQVVGGEFVKVTLRTIKPTQKLPLTGKGRIGDLIYKEGEAYTTKPSDDTPAGVIVFQPDSIGYGYDCLMLDTKQVDRPEALFVERSAMSAMYTEYARMRMALEQVLPLGGEIAKIINTALGAK